MTYRRRPRQLHHLLRHDQSCSLQPVAIRVDRLVGQWGMMRVAAQYLDQTTPLLLGHGHFTSVSPGVTEVLVEVVTGGGGQGLVA